MICQYCNSEIPDNLHFCPNCGNKLDAPASSGANGAAKKFCDNCGAPLEPGRAFCSSCGKPVEENGQQNSFYSQPPYTAQNPGAYAPQPEKKAKKTGLIAAIVIICVVLLAGGVGTALYFFVFNNDSDKKTEMTAKADDEKDDKKDDADSEEKPEEDFLPEDEDTYNDDDSDSSYSGKFDTLDDFVNSDIMQQQLETQLAAFEGTGISAELIADGNQLIYNFVIEDADLAAIMDKSTLDSSLDSQASVFEGLAAMLPAAVDVEDPVVVVRYLDNVGNIITSREFYAD